VPQSYSDKLSIEIHRIEEILSYLESAVVEQIKQRPRYIHTMGDSGALSITRIVHEGEEGEPASKDYDFSWKSIEERKEKGYKTAMKMLEKGAIHKTSERKA
jgi:Patatin phospholipase